jgi:Tfp pilus assembly protein PilX
MSKTLLKNSKRFRREAGVALMTSLLLLFLMSSLLVGFCILLVSNQQLAGSNNDEVTAFYSAEAGLEEMTAKLGDLFAQTYSPTASQINTIQQAPPSITGISFLNGDGSSGYTITSAAVDSNGNPAPTIATIKSGTYAGMTALLTEYTMVVNARTTTGREVKLQRTTQTVGIPMFQFGIFSDTDLSFFPGPNFNFGGRTHTNGNLFLAAGSTLTLSDKVDAYKDVIRATLENGWPTSSNYNGTVQITTQPGSTNYRSLSQSEGSLTGGIGSGANTGWPTISKGNAPADYNSNLLDGPGASAASKPYNTGAKLLNLGIVTIGQGATQSIDLLRRPVSGESSQVTGERYFAQASLKILLSDDPSDIMNLPCIDASTQPFDLSLMATDPGNLPGNPASSWLASPNAQLVDLAKRLNTNGVVALPLAQSGALAGAGGAYNAADGYWLPNSFPIIKGYLKVEEQTGYGSPCGTWKDVTTEVLSYGYVGRNIDPVPQSLDGVNLNPQWPVLTNQMDPLLGPWSTPGNTSGYKINNNQLSTTLGYPLPDVPMTSAAPPVPIELGFQNSGTGSWSNGTTLMSSLSSIGSPSSCLDPHPYAVIRLERIRDNPSSLYVGGYVNSGTWNGTTKKAFRAPIAAVCGVDPSTGKLVTFGGNPWNPLPQDFWPNTLFDTREGTLRDSAMSNGSNTTLPTATLNGTMHYIELDGGNLAGWFGGKITVGSTGLTTSGQGTKDPAVAPNNFVVYVSDRRGNYSSSQTIAGGWPPLSYTKKETGEYGWNDLVNFPGSTSTTGCPTGVLETGEDADNTSVLYTYGANEAWIHDAGDAPLAPATSLSLGRIGIFKNLVANGALVTPSNCGTVPGYVTDGIWPMMAAGAGLNSAPRENPAMFFRRAVKVVNGSNISAVGTCPGGNNCGLTIAAENPIYIQGDFNANVGGIGFSSSPYTVAASIAGDAVTLLSNNWNDTNSFSSPYAETARSGVTTWYRVAIIGGATPYFSNSSGVVSQDYGTDGGVHNFLRYIENWGASSNNVLNYEGSIIDLFYSRQANSTFKCCNTVYSPPSRGYNFDTNFLTPALLPPRTPLFRDVNTTGWTRLLEPNATGVNQ